MGKTTIEWTTSVSPDGSFVPGYTFSPWWGCTRVSAGCRECYASDLGRRFGVNWGKGEPRRLSSENVWSGPLKWNKAAQKAGKRVRVFCGSMMDWADDEVDPAWRKRLWDLIRICPWLDWLLLTKRPENVPGMLPHDWNRGWGHVHLGFTAENQREYDRRVAIMERVPAVRRFISAEPLLGEIDLGLDNWERRSAIHQIIAGGESGHGARAMHPNWARGLRDQAVSAGIAFHFKQHGHYREAQPGDPSTYGHQFEDGTLVIALGKKNTGRLLDGRTWDENPKPTGIING